MIDLFTVGETPSRENFNRRIEQANTTDVFLASPNLLQAYKAAGSYTWTVPAGVTKVLLAMIGGGGSGSAAVSAGGAIYVYPGGSGYAKVVSMTVVLGAQLNAVVGSGAAAVTNNQSINSGSSGTVGGNGGSTSFNGIVVSGGNGGIVSYNSGTPSGTLGGGQIPSNGSYNAPICLDYITDRTNPSGFTVKLLLSLFRPQELPFCVATSDGPPAQSSGGAYFSPAFALPNGKKTSVSVYKSSSGNGAVAQPGTDPGCGGGSAQHQCNSGSWADRSATSGAGTDGAVFVYDWTGRGDIS